MFHTMLIVIMFCTYNPTYKYITVTAIYGVLQPSCNTHTYIPACISIHTKPATHYTYI